MNLLKKIKNLIFDKMFIAGSIVTNMLLLIIFAIWSMIKINIAFYNVPRGLISRAMENKAAGFPFHMMIASLIALGFSMLLLVLSYWVDNDKNK